MFTNKGNPVSLHLLNTAFNSLRARDENKFANSVDSDEVAHNEPPYLDLHYLVSSFRILNNDTA